MHFITAVRILYAQIWKSAVTADLDKLIDKHFDAAEMDILTEKMREGDLGKIEKCWKPFYDWIIKIDNKTEKNKIEEI